MKILFVHNRYLQSAGGEDSTVHAEVDLLLKKGHTVETLIFTNDNFGGNILSKLKAGLSTIYNTASKQRLKEVIQTFQPDVIHIHNFYFAASPSVFDAAWECEVPVVLTLQNFRLVCVNALLLRENKVCEDCMQSYFPWKGVVRKCYHGSIKDSAMVGLIAVSHKLKQTWNRKINRYIVVSQLMRNKLLNSSLGLDDPQKMVVKRNFIDDPGVGKPDERGAHFLFVGRFSEEKGVDFMLRCFSAPGSPRLMLVGDGPQQEELKARYGSFPNLEFAGRKNKEEVIALLKKCRALVFPSIWYEGLPLTIIEALATGTPVIASNLGAMQEMITHGENGFLFEKANDHELRQALEAMTTRILQHDHSIHEGARQSYMNNYHPNICYAAVMDIYESVIKEKHPKAV